MGISRSELGVLVVRSGEHLGISVSGHGDLGVFGGLSELNRLFLAALRLSDLSGSPKRLTVGGSCFAKFGAGSQRSSQLFSEKIGIFCSFIEYRYTSRNLTNEGDTCLHLQQ